MVFETRHNLLCVDDEPNVLEALRRQLRPHFEVALATSGAQALEMMRSGRSFPVIVSDMRMPGMDGAELLRRVKEEFPDTIRVLLTGQTDFAAAVSAVNEGHIFRFLCKPCDTKTLLGALGDALEQHRLITSERVLLEQTLNGSIRALADTLALANPAAFGRGMRVKQGVSRLLDHLGVRDRWQVEVAAMLSQIGYVTLPAATVEKLYRGRALEKSEQEMVARVGSVTDQLLSNIPRLEPVREILRYRAKRFDGSGEPRDGKRGEAIPWGARVLKVLLDFDELETQGMSTELALDTLRGRPGWYDPAMLAAFAEALGTAARGARVRELRLSQVEAGMVFAQDVTTTAGTLLIARGQEVTLSLLERIRNFSLKVGVREPVRVILPQEREGVNSGGGGDVTQRSFG